MASVDQIQRSHSDTDKASTANDAPSSAASSSLPPSGGAGGGGGDKNAALDEILYPADSYTQGDHIYWGDLGLKRRLAWTGKQSNEEAARELAVVGRMFKKDPLSPISAYFSNYVVTGMGLFVEGYVLFSVGNLTPLFKAVWPECWKNHDVCDPGWTAAVDYLEIVGIIVGQILVGIQGDWVGRKFGMVQDALVMTLGSIMLTAMWGTSLQGWVICYAFSLFIYGIGVGGEYPMTSTRAMEAAANGGAGDRLHRGRRVALAFLMQGWGQLANQVVLILALLVTHNSLDAPFNKTSTQWTFRLQFAVIILPTLYLAYLRFYKLRYNDELSQAKKRLNTSGYDIKSLKLASSHYWHRMVGTAFVWFANDVAFYGAKIFSGVFIATINGGTATLGETWLWNLVNIGVSLVGYYMGALFIDHKMYGRKWMQANGLIAIFIFYIISGALYPQLTQPGSGVHWFQTIYFLSSFFTQFGPNTTSFLLAAEVYPASIRATAHGVSAATGKLGALLAAVVFNYISTRDKFYLTAPFAVAAWILTLICVPDVTGLDLREQERYWVKVMEGKEHEYHGVAVCPRHLSLWERVVLKRHRNYDPEEDAKDKKRELQALFESTDEAEMEKAPLSDEQKAFLRNDLGGFFATEAKLNKPSEGGGQTHESKLADLEKRLS